MPNCILFCTGKLKLRFTLNPLGEVGINTEVSFSTALLLFLSSMVLYPSESAYTSTDFKIDDL